MYHWKHYQPGLKRQKQLKMKTIRALSQTGRGCKHETFISWGKVGYRKHSQESLGWRQEPQRTTQVISWSLNKEPPTYNQLDSRTAIDRGLLHASRYPLPPLPFKKITSLLKHNSHTIWFTQSLQCKGSYYSHRYIQPVNFRTFFITSKRNLYLLVIIPQYIHPH